jgi:hypothetical protein
MPRERLLTALLLGALGVFAVLALTVFVGDRWRHIVDSAIYMLCAKSLAAGEGYAYLGLPFFVRPPGMSWLLVPFLDEPYDFPKLNLLVQVTAVLAFGGVLLAMRRLQGALLGTLVTPICGWGHLQS